VVKNSDMFMKASNMNTVNTGHSSPTKKYRDPQEEDDTVT